MKEATSGNALSTQTYTWPIANQAIAAGAAFSPAALVVRAAVGNGIPVVRARAALPATAAGSTPNVEAWISGANAVTLRISNQSAAALVATAADIVFDVMVLPLVP